MTTWQDVAMYFLQSIYWQGLCLFVASLFGVQTVLDLVELPWKIRKTKAEITAIKLKLMEDE